MTELAPLSLKTLAGALTPTEPRSEGCHVSSCIYELMKAIDPDRWGRDFSTDARENYQYAGFLWEQIVSSTLAAAKLMPELERAFELQLDGVYGTPDWFEQDTDGGLIISETKATWKSAKLFDLYDKKFMNYLMQLLAYTYMAGTLRARLYVFFVNGGQYDDYYKHIPEVHRYDLTFTEREQEENWRALTGIARKRGWL